jgi:Putative zincin peptidase
MFFVPGFVIGLLTFPGVIIHEAAHQLFCRLGNLAVFDVCYFRVGNPSGYVIHEQTDNFLKTFLVSMGPFFVNSILCVLFCSAAFLPVWELKVEDPLAYFFYWLGLSIGMHSFPSTVDLKHIWKLAPKEAKAGNLLAIFSYPLVALLYVLNYARVIWADLGYGIAIGILGPLALFKAFS